MNTMSSHGTGALPPRGMEWQMGKTAASILFVKRAEQFLEALPEAKFAFDVELQHEALREHVAKVKSGEIVLMEHLTPEEFIAQNPKE